MHQIARNACPMLFSTEEWAFLVMHTDNSDGAQNQIVNTCDVFEFGI